LHPATTYLAGDVLDREVLQVLQYEDLALQRRKTAQGPHNFVLALHEVGAEPGGHVVVDQA
jgi:hypothetical protein